MCYNVHMRAYILIFTLLTFLTTSVGSVAFANTCMDMGQTSSMSLSHEMMDMDGDNEPCQEEANTKKTAMEHCDGLCLCMSLSNNIAPLIDTDLIKSPIFISEKYAFIDEGVKPWHTSPLFRPPIQSS